MATVIVKDRDWVPIFEDLLAFRRYLKTDFGLLMRHELKATDLVRGSGPWMQLGFGRNVRHRVYRSCMRLQAKSTMKTFAVSVDKAGFTSANAVRERAWGQAFERLERFAHYGQDVVMVIADDGNFPFLRKLARHMRRHHFVGSAFGTDALPRPLVNILIDDPTERKSHESYFIQLADLNAYAAYRRVVPAAFFPQMMWHELGDAIVWQANRISGGPAGIVGG